MSLFITETDSKPKSVNKNHVKKALREGDPIKLASVLTEYAKSPSFDQEFLNESLMQVAKQGQAEIIPVLIKAGADPNSGSFKTPLQWCLMMNKEESVTALIEAGADVNYGEQPPLTIAAALGRTNAVRLMIEHGADVTLEDTDHRNALDLAENYKHAEIAEILREAGAAKSHNPILGFH